MTGGPLCEGYIKTEENGTSWKTDVEKAERTTYLIIDTLDLDYNGQQG